jgi:epoxyqueuosine reductase
MIMDLTSFQVKQFAKGLGADLCGIAPIERFENAPKGYSPKDVMPECKSVIVLAIKSVNSTLSSRTTIPYTMMRNDVYQRLNGASVKLSSQLESHGAVAVPIPADEPRMVDRKQRKIKGIISLKHAAVLAGLGKMGKNTLMINDQYGNMLWLGAVLTNTKLEADELATYDVCPAECSICLRSCPSKALDGTSIDQRKCGKFAFNDDKYGGWRIACFTCRRVCPNCQGTGTEPSK